MRCPLCQTVLPDGAQECTHCDWVRVDGAPPQATTRDEIALWLSLVPGLGHLYKGQILLGGLIFFIISPLVLALSLAVLPSTLGLSLAIPAILLFGVMLHAYRAKDERAAVILRARKLDHKPAVH
jgi:hypothetical protein